MSGGFEQQLQRVAERRAARAVAGVIARLATRLRDVPGVEVEAKDGRVGVSAPALHARRVEEAVLRDVAAWVR